MRTILAADIGGTNSRFALFHLGADDQLRLAETIWLPTGEAQSFAHLLEQLRGSGFPLPAGGVEAAVLAVAGPIEDGVRCDPPHISWDIDLARNECRGFSPMTRLLNDFVAQAYCCRSPIGLSARVLHPGQGTADGAIGVLGAGTALGKALLAPLPGKGFLALPSEGGHAYFPFLSPAEVSFQEFYKEKCGGQDITANMAVSGRGLTHLHWFLCGEELEPQDVAAKFSPESDTLAWAARFYGRVCQGFALEVLALGGLYIAGGVAAKNPEIVTHEAFLAEFRKSSTMSHILCRIPISLIADEDSGLWGAAYYGKQLLLNA